MTDNSGETVAGNAAACAAFRVIRKTYPRNGLRSDEENHIVGEYITREQANSAARTEMNSMDQFEDWGEKQFAGIPPPYSSADGPFEVTADEDEFVDIYVVDIAKEGAAKHREFEVAKASKKPQKKIVAATTTLDPSQRTFGKTTETIIDLNIFVRNPAELLGGV